MDEMNQSTNMGSQGKTMMWVWVVVIIAALLLVWYWMGSYTVQAPADSEEVVTIENELQGVDVNNLDAELSDIDKELAQ